MGDENPIRTLGDYSKPSHEGYRNTIELPVGNNVVPLRSKTIRLVQNGCSFYGLRSEDPNQHLKDFLKLVDSLDLDSDNKERPRLRLFQFSLRDQASNWLERLPNDALTPEEMSFNYENPDIEQLLGIMEHKFDTLMKDAISLMKESKSIFQLATNEEVIQRLKEHIREVEDKPKKIIKITRYPDTEVLEKSAMHDFLENPEKKTFPNPKNLLCVRYVRIIPLNSP
ncbi:hypothetical protein Tco_0174834 [Tanacetum coccineum]